MHLHDTGNAGPSLSGSNPPGSRSGASSNGPGNVAGSQKDRAAFSTNDESRSSAAGKSSAKSMPAANALRLNVEPKYRHYQEVVTRFSQEGVCRPGISLTTAQVCTTRERRSYNEWLCAHTLALALDVI